MEARLSLRKPLNRRAKAGTFASDPDQYVADCLKQAAEGRTEAKTMELMDGRTISRVFRPVAGGGWVSTHADVTQQRMAEKERDLLRQREERRAAIDEAITSFRARVENMLMTVGRSAVAMKAAAKSLLTTSGHTLQRSEGALHGSHEASANVETAAAAAEELSASIKKISRQLAQTNDVVRSAAADATATNDDIAALARVAQRRGEPHSRHRRADEFFWPSTPRSKQPAPGRFPGRGFAVVASEVKSLAVQTAKATAEITGEIASIQTSTGEAVTAIRAIMQRMQDIGVQTSEVVGAVKQQELATGEITNNVASTPRLAAKPPSPRSAMSQPE